MMLVSNMNMVMVRLTSGEQVLPARKLGGYWIYWAESPGKRAAAMLGCWHVLGQWAQDWVWHRSG